MWVKLYHLWESLRRGPGRWRQLFRTRRARRGAVLLAGAGVLAALFVRAAAAPVGCANEDLAPAALMAAAAAQSRGGQAAESGAAGAQEKSPEKVVYLTFDDGPSATTDTVLDVLKEEGVPATFFVVSAENNAKYLPTLARTVAEGHLVGLHSASHRYSKIYSSTDAFWQDIDELQAAIAPYVPEPCTCLRFPGGSSNTVSRKYGGSGIMKELKAQAEEKGYRVVDWNVCAEDAVGGHPTVQEIYDNVVREVDDRASCVVLMHDTAATKNTAKALPDIIRWFKNAGYRFDTVDHLPAA